MALCSEYIGVECYPPLVEAIFVAFTARKGTIMATASPVIERRTPHWSFNGYVHPIAFHAERVSIYVSTEHITVVDKDRNREYHIHQDEIGIFSREVYPTTVDDDGWDIPEEYQSGRSFPLTRGDRVRMYKIMQKALATTRQRFPLHLRATWRTAIGYVCEDAGPCPVPANLQAYWQMRWSQGLRNADREFPQVTQHVVLCTKCHPS